MGYMISRLTSLEPYFILQEQYKNNITLTPQYLTIGNFIEQIKYFNILYKKSNGSLRKIVLLCFYKLLTNTFITESTNKYNKKTNIYRQQ